CDELAGGLGKRSEHHRPAARAGGGEGHLVGQRRLAAARRASHDHERASRDAATQDQVEIRYPGRIYRRRFGWCSCIGTVALLAAPTKPPVEAPCRETREVGGDACTWRSLPIAFTSALREAARVPGAHAQPRGGDLLAPSTSPPACLGFLVGTV